MDNIIPILEATATRLGLNAFHILVGGASYLLFSRSMGVLKNIEDVVIMDVDARLETVLEVCPNNRVEYIGIRGVMSCLPEKTKFNPSVSLVSKRLGQIISFAKGIISPNEVKPVNIASGPTLVSPTNSQLPFKLYVDNMNWRYVYSHWSNLQCGKLDNWQGFADGSILTVFGKLQKIGPGEIRLQFGGSSDAPYIFTTYSREELLSIQNKTVSAFRIIFTVFFVLGLTKLTVFACDEALKYFKHVEETKLFKEVAPMLEKIEIVERVGDPDNLHTMCTICNRETRDVLLMECKHISLCFECTKLNRGKCPTCGKSNLSIITPIFIA